MTSQPGSNQFPAPPLYQAWAGWWQDMFALYAQMMTAQWRFSATVLETFRPWLEPGVVMTEQLAEQMLGAAEHTIGQDPTAAHPSS